MALKVQPEEGMDTEDLKAMHFEALVTLEETLKKKDIQRSWTRTVTALAS